MGLISKIFGTRSEREVKKLKPLVDRIEALGEEMKKLSDEQLRDKLGQREAGEVLGMTKSQIFFKITLMQMIKRIVPPMSNEIITLVKDTSLARIIAVYELIWSGQTFIKSAGIIWPLFYTTVFYLVFNGGLTLLFGYIERKLDFFKC